VVRDPFKTSILMAEDLISQYDDLLGRLKSVFKEFSLLQKENDRLRQEVEELQRERERARTENAKLRDELSMLRLYLDAQTHSNIATLRSLGLDVSSEAEHQEVSEEPTPPIDHRAMAFFTELPDTLSFSEIFEIGADKSIDAETVKEFLRQYFYHGLMKKAGSHLEKTGPFCGTSSAAL